MLRSSGSIAILLFASLALFGIDANLQTEESAASVAAESNHESSFSVEITGPAQICSSGTYWWHMTPSGTSTPDYLIYGELLVDQEWPDHYDFEEGFLNIQWSVSADIDVTKGDFYVSGWAGDGVTEELADDLLIVTVGGC